VGALAQNREILERARGLALPGEPESAPGPTREHVLELIREAM
jgi:hypothetical protein